MSLHFWVHSGLFLWWPQSQCCCLISCLGQFWSTPLMSRVHTVKMMDGHSACLLFGRLHASANSVISKEHSRWCPHIVRQSSSRHALEKVHVHSIQSLRSFSSTAFETQFQRSSDWWRPFLSFQGRLALPLSMPLLQAIGGAMSLALCPQVLSQVPQHFSSSQTQAMWQLFHLPIWIKMGVSEYHPHDVESVHVFFGW